VTIAAEAQEASMIDPVFAAIEIHQQANVFLEQATGEAADAEVEMEIESADRLLQTVPATAAAATAWVRYIKTASGMRERVIADTCYGEMLFGTLERMRPLGCRRRSSQARKAAPPAKGPSRRRHFHQPQCPDGRHFRPEPLIAEGAHGS
jgi:hypothetical protein